MLLALVMAFNCLVSYEQFGVLGFAPSIGSKQGARMQLLQPAAFGGASLPVLSLSSSSQAEEFIHDHSSSSTGSRSHSKSTLRRIFNTPKKLLIAAALTILSTLTAMPSVANAWLSRRNINATIEIHPEGHHQESFPGSKQQSTSSSSSAEHSQKIHVMTATGVVIATGASGYAKVAARSKEQQRLVEQDQEEELLEEDSTFPMVMEFPPETTSIPTTTATYVPKIPSLATVQRNRQQPRPANEAKALSEYYASIPNLSDRAFQILLDLGMVEIHSP
jgi:hypothetical protein